uniref:Secreted protein n=1 Tax=Mesocestoides corti TaxID=53468 RepID=A0A5K3FT30_MESCO
MSGAVHPSPPRWLRRSLYTASHTCLFLVGCISSSHAIGKQRQMIGRGQRGPICLRSYPSPRATGQASSIRVHDAGHAAQCILLLVHVILWLAGSLPCMLMERRETQDWLRLAWSNTSAPWSVATLLPPQE